MDTQIIVNSVIGICGGVCVGTIVGHILEDCVENIVRLTPKGLPIGVTRTVLELADGNVVNQVIDRRKMYFDGDLEFCCECYSTEYHVIGSYIGDGHMLVTHRNGALLISDPTLKSFRAIKWAE